MKKSNNIRKRAAFALTEILVTSAAASIMMAALSAGVITMKRTFVVNLGAAESESEMMRLADYLSMDLRRAETISTGSDAEGNSVLTVTLPDCYESDEPSNPGYRQLRAAAIVDGTVVYGTGNPVTVQYKLAAGDVRRYQSGFPVSVVSGTDSFTLTLVDDRIKSEVAYTATFTSHNSPIFAAPPRTVEGVVRTRNPRKD
jgi:hypothetical protein